DMFFRDLFQRPRASQINRQRHEQNQNSGHAWSNMDAAEEKARERFINDVNCGQDQQTRLDKRREIFKLSVSVWMTFICGLIGNSYRQIRNRRSDQIQTRMQRL